MSRHETIVIGAGIAGLAAARALVDAGQDVLVLEARTRVGGRMWSVDGFDYGAGWIHGTEGNPLTNLVHDWALPLRFVGGDSSYIGGWDRLVFPSPQAPDKDRSIIAADRVFDALEEARHRAGSDGGLAAAVERAIADLVLDESEAAAARWHLAAIARDDGAAPPDGFSHRHWDEGYEVHGYGDSVLPGGTQAISERLAESLDVRLGQVVERVGHGDGGIVVEAAGESFHADRVIVTLPLGVLKAGDVAFDPPLPPAKQAAIDRLGWGLLVKVAVHFAAPCWPERPYVFGMLPPLGGFAPTQVLNGLATGAGPVLVLMIGGDDGRAVEAMDERARSDWAMAVLRHNFGADMPEPEAVRCTHWGSDPFARGAYSHVAAGGSARDFATLAEPVGEALWFAGEATSPHQWATMHGAYMSGLSAAAAILSDATILPVAHFTENRRWRAISARGQRFLNLRRSELGTGEMAARLAVLDAAPVFADVEWAERALLATMLEPRRLQAGEMLCRAGDAADAIYLVAAGEIRVTNAAGEAIAAMGPGELGGEYGMFGAALRTAGLEAEGEALVYALDYARFRRFLLAYPEAALALLGQGIGRLLP